MAVSHKKLASWYLQMAHSLEAGINLSEALRMAGGPPRRDTMTMADNITAGFAIDDMLKNVPPWLTQTDRYLLSAAGSSGRLPETLHKLNEKHMQTAENISKAILASIYPLAVLHLGIFLFPVLNLMEFDVETGSSMNLDRYFSALIPVLLPFWFLLSGFIVLVKKRNPIIRWIMGIVPGLRGYRKAQAIADFSFALEAFINAGAPMDDAWYGSGLVSGDPALTKFSLNVSQEIKNGKPPGSILETSRIFPFEFISLYKNGEETGQLDTVLATLTHQFQEKANRRLAVVSFWYPKLLFLLLAIFIAIKVVGYYAQYFKFIYDFMD